MAENVTLTSGQLFLLRWLSKEDSSSYGECCGADLDQLLRLGLAKVTPERRGGGFNQVSLTDHGWAFHKANPE